jgi:hypothetical protein
MWFALKLLGFGKTLLDLGLRFVAWLCEDWLRLIVAGFVILSAVLWFRGNDYRSERNDAQAGWQAEINAHKQTEANYRQASAQALAAAKENKVRVETKYKVIENAQDKDIRARLAAATASLRARAANTDPGSPDAIGLPSLANAAVDPVGNSGDAKLDDALICTTNTVKAQGWQDWYDEAQSVTRQ